MVVGFTTEPTDTILLAYDKLIRGTPLASRIGNGSRLFGYILDKDDDVDFGDTLDMGSNVADGTIKSLFLHVGPIVDRTKARD